MLSRTSKLEQLTGQKSSGKVNGPEENRDEVSGFVESFRRALMAQNKSPKTVTSYMNAAHGLVAFLRDQGCLCNFRISSGSM